MVDYGTKADMAELADAHDSKSCGKPCGFESRYRQKKAPEIPELFVLQKMYYLVPKILSPASPRPGQIYAFSFSSLSMCPM